MQIMQITIFALPLTNSYTSPNSIFYFQFLNFTSQECIYPYFFLKLPKLPFYSSILVFPSSVKNANFLYTENITKFHNLFPIILTHDLSLIFFNFNSKNSLLICRNKIVQNKINRKYTKQVQVLKLVEKKVDTLYLTPVTSTHHLTPVNFGQTPQNSEPQLENYARLSTTLSSSLFPTGTSPEELQNGRSWRGEGEKSMVLHGFLKEEEKQRKNQQISKLIKMELKPVDKDSVSGTNGQKQTRWRNLKKILIRPEG